MPPCRDNAGEILVFGCGRWFCRDDQVGLIVAQTLETRDLAGVHIISSENPGADLPGCLTDERLLVIVDAAAADAKHSAGTWQRIDARRVRAPTAPPHRANTHTIGVDVALSLAADLGVLPETVWVYAIAIDAAERGEDVTPSVQRAASEVTDAIAADIQGWQAIREQQHA